MKPSMRLLPPPSAFTDPHNGTRSDAWPVDVAEAVAEALADALWAEVEHSHGRIPTGNRPYESQDTEVYRLRPTDLSCESGRMMESGAGPDGRGDEERSEKG